MKKKIKFLCVALMMMVSAMAFVTNIYAAGGLTEEEGKIIIPFEKNWDESATNRPNSIKVTLYKYLGDTFNVSTAIKVEEADVTAANNWKYNYDISDEALADSNNNFYKFKVVETPINGFYEMSHTDPGVTFIPPSIGDGWTRITPCNNLQISTTGDFKSIIFMKKGSDYVVWSVEPLADSERQVIFPSIQNISGMHGVKFENITFISGLNGSHKGMTVKTDHIDFEDTSNWSMVATGLYFKSSTETNSSQITNAANLVDYTVSKTWNDHDNIEKIRPTSVNVNLLADGVKVNEVTLSANNEWTHTFSGLKEYNNGNKIKYTVEETTITGYTPNYKYNNDNNSVIIENVHIVEPTEVKVIKKWQNHDIFMNNMPTIILNLYYKVNENDTWKLISTVDLKSNGNVWEHTWKSANGFDILPKSYIYKVEEVGFKGIDDADYIFENFFDVSYEKNNNNFTIINKCNATFELPETGSHMMLFILIALGVLLGIPSIYMVYTFVKKHI